MRPIYTQQDRKPKKISIESMMMEEGLVGKFETMYSGIEDFNLHRKSMRLQERRWKKLNYGHK